MKFSQLTSGKVYVGAKGISREIISIGERSNEVVYREGGAQARMPGQEFAKWAITVHRDRSNDKPKQEKRAAR